MKKLIELLTIILGIILGTMCFTACSQSSLDVAPIDSDIHPQSDYEKAIDIALETFKGFKGVNDMTEIKYAGDDTVKREAEWRGCNPKDVIVLESTFTTNEDGSEGGFNPNEKYTGWQWIIVKDENGNWKHKDHGYG